MSNLNETQMFGLVILSNGVEIDLDGGVLCAANLKSLWSKTNAVVAISDGSIPAEECEVYVVCGEKDFTFTSAEQFNTWLSEQIG
ncbi:hypothetical protein [Vibrio phage vB_VpaS_CHI]|nr:hypothetical protein [Vibrio phage vB_VpaS_ALK]USL90113.1 hypothetical protein [Vibrio phage vB_VpaS_CHI]